MLFLATGGGKLSYFGSKEWLEENIDEGGGGRNQSYTIGPTLFFHCHCTAGLVFKGHLSNEDAVCSPNHIDLCTHYL